MHDWTSEEEALLRREYPDRGSSWDGWGELLPGRSELSIRKKASRLGIRAKDYRTWKDWETESLEDALYQLSHRFCRSPRSVAAKMYSIAEADADAGR